jgi:hypothetical protein
LVLLEGDVIKNIKYFEIARRAVDIIKRKVVAKELEERVIAKLSKDYNERATNGKFQLIKPHETKQLIADFYIGKYKDYAKAIEILDHLQKDFPNEESVVQKYRLTVQEKRNREIDQERNRKDPIYVKDVIDVDKTDEDEIGESNITSSSMRITRIVVIIVVNIVLIICIFISIMRYRKK